jgi:hypothetical protein
MGFNSAFKGLNAQRILIEIAERRGPHARCGRRIEAN